jgi:ribosomal protein S18 acetylase RimI-like enzyme
MQAYVNNRSDLLFPNPPLEALRSTMAHFALCVGRACKFPRRVAPFGAVEENTAEAMAELKSLMEPGESIYAVSFEQFAKADGLIVHGPEGVLQFEWPEEAEPPELAADIKIEPLDCAQAADMVELTSVAFPGYFRERTCEMGAYYGIRNGGSLAAMGGERLAIGRFREISGVCTLEGYRGRGYASALIAKLLQDHRAAGLRSYLHVAADNTNAIALYERMGFRSRGEFPVYVVTRDDRDGWRETP